MKTKDYSSLNDSYNIFHLPNNRKASDLNFSAIKIESRIRLHSKHITLFITAVCAQ